MDARGPSAAELAGWLAEEVGVVREATGRGGRLESGAEGTVLEESSGSCGVDGSSEVDGVYTGG